MVLLGRTRPRFIQKIRAFHFQLPSVRRQLHLPRRQCDRVWYARRVFPLLRACKCAHVGSTSQTSYAPGPTPTSSSRPHPASRSKANLKMGACGSGACYFHLHTHPLPILVFLLPDSLPLFSSPPTISSVFLLPSHRLRRLYSPSLPFAFAPK
jgi:hypothetical protein